MNDWRDFWSQPPTSTAFPVSWAYQRLGNGDGDNVWHKYRMVIPAGDSLAAGDQTSNQVQPASLPEGTPAPSAAPPLAPQVPIPSRDTAADSLAAISALGGLPVHLRESFVLVRSCGPEIPYDFWISTYPVLCDAEQASPRLGHDDEIPVEISRTSWLEATRFCNHLSAASHLPVAHDPETGSVQPVHPGAGTVTGFRLPTPSEWEHAAKGWSGTRRGGYQAIHGRHFKVPELDGPLSPAQSQAYAHGYAQSKELFANELGLYGLLGYAREWTCGPDRVLKWEEYILNYDNAVGYRVAEQQSSVGQRLAFRVVLPCATAVVAG
jgi:hypothetical protein